MFKLIAFNYTVLLNGYSQWLNIRGGVFHRDIGSIVSVILAFSHKHMPLKNYKTNMLSLCSLYIILKILSEIIAI